jgi:hypothetical protein
MFRIGDRGSLNLTKVNQGVSSKIDSPRSALNRFKNDLKINLARLKGVDLRTARTGGLADGEGLTPLGGGRRSIDQVLQELLELHQQFGKDAGESLADSLTKMSDPELLQVYKNLNNNSGILSAIIQSHGKASEFYVFAEGVLNLVTNTVRQREMSAHDIKPKPFDLHDPKSRAIVETLHHHATAPARAAHAATQKLTILGGGKPEPRELLKLFQDHRAVFSSTLLWSSDRFKDNYEALGLALAITELRRIAGKVDQTGRIDADDVNAIRSALKTAREEQLPGLVTDKLAALKTTSDDPGRVLFDLARIVADHYVEIQPPSDEFSFFGETARLNLQGQGRADLEKGLAVAYAQRNARALVEVLEQGFVDFVKTNAFERRVILEPLEMIAGKGAPHPEPEVILRA